MSFKVNFNGKEKKVERDEHGGLVMDGVSFDGHCVSWSFDYKPYTYLKESELSGDQWRKGGELTIYRNGVSVMKEFCREPERAIRLLHYFMPKFYDFFNWDDLKPGKKLYNHDVPCHIESVLDDGEIIVKTENGEPFPWAFKIEAEKNGGEYDDEWGDEDKVHILSEHLYWHRK